MLTVMRGNNGQYRTPSSAQFPEVLPNRIVTNATGIGTRYLFYGIIDIPINLEPYRGLRKNRYVKLSEAKSCGAFETVLIDRI